MNDEQFNRFSRGEAPPSNGEKPDLNIGRSFTIRTLLALTLGLSVSACNKSSKVASSPSDTAPPAASGSASASSGSIVSVGGAGATYPAPLYQRWFGEYNKVNPGTQVSYQSVGSGAGVEQFLAGTVDFGASDAPLKADERAKFKTKFGGEPDAAGAEAFVGEKVPDDLGLTVPDSTNPKAYPISGLTWLLLYPQPKDATKTTALKAVIEWALTTGKASATELGYLPLDDGLVTKAKAELSKVK